MNPSASQPSLKTIVTVYLALLILLLMTVGATLLQFNSHLALLLSLAIAFAKAVLVLLFFMKLKYAQSSLKIFFLGALLWAGLLASLVSIDYLTR